MVADFGGGRHGKSGGDEERIRQGELTPGGRGWLDGSGSTSTRHVR